MVAHGHPLHGFVAVAGTTTPKKFNSNKQKRLIKDIIVYDKDFRNIFEFSHDIALLTTVKPFKLNDNVKLIKWAKNVNYDETATVFGWGMTRTSLTPKILQKRDVTLIPHKKCREMAKLINLPEPRTYEICTTESICNGDSGGALIQIMNGQPTLIGIVSWSHKDCSVPPAVFVNPGFFDAWLNFDLKRLS